MESRLCCRAQQHRSGRLRPPSSLGSRRRIEANEQTDDVMDRRGHLVPHSGHTMVALSKASTEATYGHTAGTLKPSLEAPRSTHGGTQVGHNGGITRTSRKQQQYGRADGAAVHGGRHQGRWHSSRAEPRPHINTITVTKLHSRCSTRRAARKPHYLGRSQLTYSPHTHTRAARTLQSRVAARPHRAATGRTSTPTTGRASAADNNSSPEQRRRW